MTVLRISKKIPMPSGCSSADWDDQSFVWTSPISVVVNVDCETSKKFIKKVAINSLGDSPHS